MDFFGLIESGMGKEVERKEVEKGETWPMHTLASEAMSY